MEDAIFIGNINQRFFAGFVFDGHNGPAAAQFLENRMQSTLAVYLPEETEVNLIEQNIRSAICKLGREFRRKKSMDGSTLCGCIIDLVNAVVYVVNLGDSQCVLHGLGGICVYESTRDTLDTEAQRAAVRTKGIKVTCDSQGVWRMCSLNMSRAFGNYHTGELDSALNRTGRVPSIHKVEFPKTRCNLAIMLASDGVVDDLALRQVLEVPLLRRMTCKKIVSLVQTDGLKGDNIALLRFTVSRSRQ